MLGQTGDYEWSQAFSSGGWLMLRTAPNYTLENASGALISKMDTTQHNRGWDLSIRKGIVSVELVNESPKELTPSEVPFKKYAQEDSRQEAKRQNRGAEEAVSKDARG